jgi:hypothetical protein
MRLVTPTSTVRLRARCVRAARGLLAGTLCVTLAGGCLPIGIRGSNLPSFAGAGAAPATGAAIPTRIDPERRPNV